MNPKRSVRVTLTHDTAVIRRRGVTRSQISRQLVQLDDQAGTQLLRRTTRRLEMTDSGQSLYEHGLRILQEVAVFATRIDVAEELGRLQTHLDEVERVLKQGGACGKRLDFLMQGLNREANTLGSKSAVTEVSQASMDLKLLIEQMREQIQNLE